MHEFSGADDDSAPDPFAETASKRQVASRQSEYQLRRFNRELDNEKRADPFAKGEDGAAAGKEGGSEEESGYALAMRRAELEREEKRVEEAIKEKEKERREQAAELGLSATAAASLMDAPTPRKRRWDVGTEENTPPRRPGDTADTMGPRTDETAWEKQGEPSAEQPAKKRRSRWDQTPLAEGSPAAAAAAANTAVAETPRRSRWDQTPLPGQAAAPAPIMNTANMVPFSFAMNAFDKANRYLSDQELDQMLPSEGYEIIPPPEGYAPIRTPARKLQGAPMGATGFMMQDEMIAQDIAAALAGPELSTEIEGVGTLAFFKAEDAKYFEKILNAGAEGAPDEASLSLEELKERKIMRLLLKIKNGTPPMRKTALRQITDKAREFGAGPLFDKILPLLMERTLEDQERHLLVKVIDRILYKLDDLVRPYVHKILVVIEPLLIDEDYYARVEGREIISNLSKAAGLAHMISTMRPDIDHVDEYVRNTTARAFAVVASALGIPSLLPFLKAVCRSKKSWQARHTGIKIVQQIAIMLGCAVLPHLKNLVESIAHGLEDEQQKVRTMTALAIAALAEAAAPYGIESFDSVLKPLWTGIRKHRGKGLAAFLKAIGFIIPLMDSEYANYYTKEVMIILIREFQVRSLLTLFTQC